MEISDGPPDPGVTFRNADHLQYIVNHVFMPTVLPQSDEQRTKEGNVHTNDFSKDGSLGSALADSASTFAHFSSNHNAAVICSMLQDVAVLHADEYTESLLCRSFNRLKDTGGMSTFLHRYRFTYHR